MKHPHLLPLPDVVQARIDVARNASPGRWCIVAKYDVRHPLAATLVWHMSRVAATIYGAQVECGGQYLGHLYVLAVRFEQATLTYPSDLN